ncbi:MAG: HAD-IA family hydrolase, partial [Candidatus Nanopelagicales bacterium]|nr:HAD-IA family hydrolase [Candidatus Nanopelagicales bacterium]
VLVDSSELGSRKPDPHPYEVAIAEMGMPAGDIVFIDDNPSYVDGGIRAGLRSIHLDVRDPAAAFRAAARELGIAEEVVPTS